MKLAVLLLALSFHPLFAQNDFNEIDNFLEAEMRTWHIPNVSIGIVRREGIVYTKEYGADKRDGNYLIGSISKSFTAIAAMKLVEQGKLGLDEPVKKYLNWFETSNRDVSDKITVRHLLNQTSGLPKNAGFFTPKSQDQKEIEQAYKAYFSSLDADQEALGKVHIYCNLNYQLLGQVIQKASGMKYAAYVSKFILTPCEMKNTFATYRETQKFGLKNGYQYLFGLPVKRTFTYNDNGIAAGDMASSAADMGKLLQVLLKNGKTGNDSLLSGNALKQLHTPVSNRYGMGFSIGDWNGLHSIRHTGLTRNYSSAINILPDENYGIVILTNINSFYAVRSLMDGVIRRLNNQEQIRYTPYEVYFRYGILALLVWSLGSFLVRLNKWRKKGFIIGFSTDLKIVSGLIIGLFMALIWLIIVPYYAELPLLTMPKLQPDLGYTLIIGAIVGVCSAFVQYVLKSIAGENTNK